MTVLVQFWWQLLLLFLHHKMLFGQYFCWFYPFYLLYSKWGKIFIDGWIWKEIISKYFDPYIPFLLSFYTFLTYYIIILGILSYFGSHLDCHFETRANLNWLTRNFQITHSNKYLDKVPCLYPDVHDFLHNSLHYSAKVQLCPPNNYWGVDFLKT